MGTEIERKFLVKGDGWRGLGVGEVYRQGYLSTKPEATVRVRLVGDRGFLTIKGKSTLISRLEYEYAIPVTDAIALLDSLCEPPLIEKTRYTLVENGCTWEIDEFTGENQGLIVAEIELTDENQCFELPEWIGQEVSHDPRYFNANLVKHPYSQWSAES